jgi:hypothetical protein
MPSLMVNVTLAPAKLSSNDPDDGSSNHATDAEDGHDHGPDQGHLGLRHVADQFGPAIYDSIFISYERN